MLTIIYNSTKNTIKQDILKYKKEILLFLITFILNPTLSISLTSLYFGIVLLINIHNIC